MIVDFKKRVFLKRTACLIAVFPIILYLKNFFLLNNRKKSSVINNFYFARKNYRSKTVHYIFENYLKKKSSFNIIMYNIEKRRNISYLNYKKNIKFLNPIK